jgi:cytochrome c biogenesis protein CcdA
MPTRQPTAQHDPRFWYLLLAAIVGVLALAGYTGYVLYPRFDLPAVTGIGLLVLAAGAGIASFFSPCSFPLLVSLLARESGAGAGTTRNRLTRPLRFATALALGATLFLLLTGIAIALGAAALFADVTFTSTAGRLIRLMVGALLIVLGLIQLGLLPVSLSAHAVASPLMQRQARLRREQPTLGYGLFGFGYLLAGFG